MKRLAIAISAAVLCSALLSGCTGGYDGQMDILTPGLLPEGYTLEQAVADGCFVVQSELAIEEEDILSGQASWDRFLERSQDGEPAFVRLLFCQENEDGSIQLWVFDLIYDGASYTVYYNDGEWTTAGTDLYGRQYDHLLALEETDQSGGVYTHMVLTDDGDATLEDYQAWVDLGSPSGYDSEDLWRYNHLVTFYTPEAER